MQGSSITQRISLEGGEAIRSQLQAIGQAGERMSARLNEVAAGANEGLSRFSSGVNGAKEAAERAIAPVVSLFDEFERGQRGAMFSTLGSSVERMVTAGEGLPALVAGFAAIGGALFALAHNAADATREIQNQAATLGLDIEKFEQLKLAAGIAGVAQEQFVGLMERFSAALGRAKAVQEQAAVADRQQAEAAAAAREKLAQSAREGALAEERYASAQRESALAITAADNASTDAQTRFKRLREDFLMAPTPDFSNLSGRALVLAQRGEEDRKRRLQEAQDAADAAEERARQVRERQEQAEEQHRIEQQRRAEEQERLRQQAELGAERRRTADEQTQIKSAGMLVAAGAGGGDVVDTLGRFADQLNAIQDGGERAAMAMAALGRGWAELDPLLKLGSQRIHEVMEANKGFVVEITEGDKNMAAAFNAAMARVSTVVEGLKNAVGNIVSQIFTPILNAIANLLKDNVARIREWAAAATDAVREFAQGFGAVLLPALQAAAETVGVIARTIIAAVNGLTAAINGAFGTHLSAGVLLFVAALAPLRPMLTLMIAAADALAEIFNRLFGTDVSGGRIIGMGVAFAGLGKIILSVGGALHTLSRAFTLDLVLSAVEKAGAAFTGFIAIITRARNAMIAFDLASLANSWTIAIGLFAAGLIAVAVGIAAFTGHLDDLTKKLEEIRDKAKEVAKSLFGAGAGDGDTAAASAPSGAASGAASTDYNALGDAIAARENTPVAAGSPAYNAQHGYAKGGAISGGATGAPRPILAHVGEFVTRAAAVAHYGVGFMQRINNLELPRFDLGGLVAGALGGVGQHIGAAMTLAPEPLPAFASGGYINKVLPADSGDAGGRPVHVHVGDKTFVASAAPSVAEQLDRELARAAVTSLGKPPSWSRGR